MTRAYTMRGVLGAAERAVELTGTLLQWHDPASRVHDVQDDPRFQHRGIDLLWEHRGGKLTSIEVKGDRHARRQTYFFELVSNVEKNTPGCFLYSEADWLLYVFLETREVHQLPLPAVRQWFLGKENTFPLRKANTQMGTHFYTTVGATVPISDVMRNISDAKRYRVEGARAAPITLSGGDARSRR